MGPFNFLKCHPTEINTWPLLSPHCWSCDPEMRGRWGTIRLSKLLQDWLILHFALAKATQKVFEVRTVSSHCACHLSTQFLSASVGDLIRNRVLIKGDTERERNHMFLYSNLQDGSRKEATLFFSSFQWFYVAKQYEKSELHYN